MGKPWEKYAQADESGPWTKYEDHPDTHTTGEKVDAAIQGFGNTASMGLLPTMQAGAGMLVDNLSAHGPARDFAREFSKPDEYGNTGKITEPEQSFGDNYARAVSQLDQKAKDMPEAYYGGAVTAGALGGGAGLIKGGPAAATGLVKAAKSPIGRMALRKGAETVLPTGLAYGLIKYLGQ